MRKMQEFAAGDAEAPAEVRQRQAEARRQEMQKLQSQHGVNPLGGCLPVLVQVPVFIGLFHVLREFEPGKTENYFFDAREVESFNAASLFGAKLGAWVTMGAEQLDGAGHVDHQHAHRDDPADDRGGHLHPHHRAALGGPADRGPGGQPADRDHEQADAVRLPDRRRRRCAVPAAGRPLYWVANNLWTLGQQYVVYRKIDAEEAEKKTQAMPSGRPAPPAGPEAGPPRDRRRAPRRPRAPSRSPGARPTADGAGVHRDRRRQRPRTARRSAPRCRAPERTARTRTTGNAGTARDTSRPGAGGPTRPPARRPRKRR